MQQAAAPAVGRLRYTHRSYSQIKQLRTCGYQFKLERIDKVPSRPGAANVAGSVVHTGTEWVDQQIHAGTFEREGLISEALKLANEALDAELAAYEAQGWTVDAFRAYGYRPKQDVAWYRTTGIPNSISAYVDWRLETAWPLAEVPEFGPAIEVPFNYYIGDQLIHGMIDRVFVPEGKVTPVDLKSGKKPATDEQLGLYAAALHKALGWEVTWGYYLYELKKGQAKLTPPLRVDHWTDEKLGEVYLPATQLIDLGIYIPSPGDNCMFCSVADACPFAQSVV